MANPFAQQYALTKMQRQTLQYIAEHDGGHLRSFGPRTIQRRVVRALSDKGLVLLAGRGPGAYCCATDEGRALVQETDHG